MDDAIGDPIPERGKLLSTAEKATLVARPTCAYSRCASKQTALQLPWRDGKGQVREGKVLKTKARATQRMTEGSTKVIRVGELMYTAIEAPASRQRIEGRIELGTDQSLEEVCSTQGTF